MEKVIEAVKFYYGLTSEQYKHVLSVLESDRKKQKREMTALIVINAVILVLLFLIWNYLK